MTYTRPRITRVRLVAQMTVDPSCPIGYGIGPDGKCHPA